MPYPVDIPMIKHDLASPPLLLPSTSLMEHMGFRSAASLFEALDHGESVSTAAVPLASVYSYQDGPSPPLSRELLVIGVADASLAAVRQLTGDGDTDNDVGGGGGDAGGFQRCTVAVKRADGAHSRRLKERDVANARNFAGFLRRLRKEGAVAILGPDKFRRFAILRPTDDMTADGDDFEAQDFAAACFVGSVDRAKEYLQLREKGCPIAPPAAATIPGSTEESQYWKPPEPEADGGGGGQEFWQPPSSADDASGAFVFGAAVTAREADPWPPPPPPAAALSEQRRVDAADANGGDKGHADAGAAAADRFYSGLTRTLDTRADSRLYHMRAFNGWVKATQIQELDPKVRADPDAAAGPGSHPKVGAPLRVLDLACGKGGDLGKWVLHPRGIGNYVGIDVARGSLVDAAIRARNMGRNKLKRCTFTCADLGADVPGRFKSARHRSMQKLSTWSLQREQQQPAAADPEFMLMRGGGISLDDKFDIVSIQFAIHYMMQTRKRARRFFQTVSELLGIGGNLIATTIDARVVVNHLMNMGLNLHFDDSISNEPVVISVGGGACRIRFEPEIVKQIFTAESNVAENVDERLFGLEYTFTLVEGSDHASGVGDAVNLPEWLIPIPVLVALGREAGLELEYAQNFHEFFSQRSDPSMHAGAHSSMYNMKVLNRNGSISTDEFEISRLYVALKFRKVRESTMQLDDVDEDDSADDEEANDIDPVMKAKLFPMALMKAKSLAGNDSWASMSSEEKNRLTEIELRKLVPKI